MYKKVKNVRKQNKKRSRLHAKKKVKKEPIEKHDNELIKKVISFKNWMKLEHGKSMRVGKKQVLVMKGNMEEEEKVLDALLHKNNYTIQYRKMKREQTKIIDIKLVKEIPSDD